jgi:hypothetical protein
MHNLEIREATPSLNRIWCKHWTRAFELRRKWHTLVRVARIEAKIASAKPLSTRVLVNVTRYGPRMLDHDNFVGGCKFLIDGLVKERLVENDDPHHIEANYTQHVGRPHRTLVSIKPVAALPAAED